MASAIETYLLALASATPQDWSLTASSSTQAFTAAVATTVTGLSANLGAGTYAIETFIFWSPSGTTGSTHVHSFEYSGTVSAVALNSVCWQAQSANAISQATSFGYTNTALTGLVTSPTHVAFAGWTEIRGTITVTVPGILQPAITLTTAGDDVTTQPGSYMRVVQLP